MSSATTSVTEYLRAALGGSLIGQMAATRDISVEALLTPDSEALNTLRAELEEFGVDPELLATQALAALTALMIEPDNADRIVTELTRLLWSILGDPKSGTPPEIYRQAGSAMHLSFIGILSPQILEPFFKSLE
jgi:hypothetical protein